MQAILVLAVAVAATASSTSTASTTSLTATWNTGDLFAGVSNGSYQVYDNAGNFKETITDGMGGFTTGCAFNPGLTKLYTTNFSASDVVVYDDPHPHPVVQTVPTGKDLAESIVFNAAGNFFVGGPLDPQIEEYDSAGNLVDNDTVTVTDGTGGPDWIDLAADQQTMFYATEGATIYRFDVVNDVQLPNFATGLPGSDAFALRLLPPGDGSGGLLVADSQQIVRLDGAGNVVQTYDVAGEDVWFALNLDPNGTSFWSGGVNTANFYRFNIATGAVEVGPINTGTGSNTLFGLCLKGEITAAIGQITLSPLTASNPSGTSHTVTATVTSGGNPSPGVLVSFSVASGPNTGQVSDPGECSADPNCMTDANGQVSWTYTSNGSPGTDTIQACFTDTAGPHCATAQKTWTAPTNACGSSPNPACVIEIRPRSMFLDEPAGADNCVGLTINILLGKVSDGTVSIDWKTVAGTAKAPQDYDNAGATVTFPSGTNTVPISVCINDDNVTEPRESFSVQLLRPVNATIEATGQKTTIFINSNTN